MTDMPYCCYHLTIIVIMSDIAELEIVIAKKRQRGDELDKQMTNEWRLL